MKETVVEYDDQPQHVSIACTCSWSQYAALAWCPVHGYRGHSSITTTINTVPTGKATPYTINHLMSDATAGIDKARRFSQFLAAAV